MWYEPTVVAGGAMLAAMVAGSSGFGFGLIASAIWLHALAPSQTVPLVAACSMLLNLVIVWRLWQEVQLRLLWPFLLGAMAGVPIGVAVLNMIDAELVRRAVGLLLVAYSAYMFRLPAMPVLQMSHAGGRAADGAVGLAGGFMGGATSLNGILPTIWCGLRGWSKSEQRGVFQPYILIVHGLTLGWLGGASGFDLHHTGRNLLLCLPALAIGGWAGLWLFRSVGEQGFRKLILGLFMLSGIGLLF